MPTIKPKRSDTTGNLPSPIDGEFSIQRADKRVLVSNTTTVFDAFQNTVSNITISNSSGAFKVGNTTVNTVINSTSISIANSTVPFVVVAPTAADYAAATKFLSANGSYLTPAGGSAIPNGSNLTVQFSNSGAFGGSNNFTYNPVTSTLSLAGTFTVNGDYIVIGNATVNATINSVSLVFANSTVTYQPVSAYAQTAFTQQQYFTLGTLTDGATINWAVNTAQKAKVTLGGSRTMAAVTGAVEGATYLLWVLQDATGSRTLSWTTTGAGSFDFGTAGAPTLTTTASQGDLLSFEAITIASTLKLRFAGIAKGFA